MRIKLKYPDVETFIQKYAVNISRGGIFIATKQPKAIGTLLRFEFMLANPEGTSLIRGEGQVQWVREFDPAQPQRAHGMGIKFTRLDEQSQALVDRALAFRAAQSGPRRLPGESESIPVATLAPPGATPEPMQLTPTPAPSQAEPPTARFDAPRAEQEAERLTTERGLPVPLQAEDEPGPRNARLSTRRQLDADRSPTERELPSAPDEVTAVSAAPEPSPRTLSRGAREGRARSDSTRPLSVEPAAGNHRPRDVVTRPIQLPDGPAGREGGTRETLLPDESVEIALKRHRLPGDRRRRGDELDELAREWGVSEERWRKTLRRKRPRMVEATAELEHLLRKPPPPPLPTLDEAMARLREMLARPR